MKLTKAQREFLKRHIPGETLSKWNPTSGRRTYDFVGRCAEAGLIEIVEEGALRWPFGWTGTRITSAGVAALA